MELHERHADSTALEQKPPGSEVVSLWELYLKSSCYFLQVEKKNTTLTWKVWSFAKTMGENWLADETSDSWGWKNIIFLMHYRFRWEEGDDVWSGFLLIPVSDQNIYASESLKPLPLYLRRNQSIKNPLRCDLCSSPQSFQWLLEFCWSYSRTEVCYYQDLNWSYISCNKKCEHAKCLLQEVKVCFNRKNCSPSDSTTGLHDWLSVGGIYLWIYTGVSCTS